MKLTNRDLNFVLTRTPKDILGLFKKYPGILFMAGGFIRSVISGEPISDVDLFGDTKERLLNIAKDLSIERKGRYFSTDNAITVLAPPRHPVQLITRWTFTDPQELINTFDFTVCQAAIWGYFDPPLPSTAAPEFHFTSVCSEHFYEDLAAKRLVYTYPQREEEPGGSLIRAFKFVKRGWNIQAPSIAGVCSRLAKAVDHDKNERDTAVIMTGLLRQVDPLRVIDGVDVALDEHEAIQP